MSGSIIEHLSAVVEDRTGEYLMEARLLQRFGEPSPYLTREKITELWRTSSQHDVLFSDHTEGKVEPFLDTLFNPRAVWYELFHTEEQAPVGVAYISRVIPMFDADVHLAIWDGVASGRQPIAWELMDHTFEEFRLQRLSAAIPIYQSGTIRFVKKLGFKEEGQKREAVVRKGEWYPQVLFGITRAEMKEIKNG